MKNIVLRRILSITTTVLMVTTYLLIFTPLAYASNLFNSTIIMAKTNPIDRAF